MAVTSAKSRLMKPVFFMSSEMLTTADAAHHRNGKAFANVSFGRWRAF
jgi:hypothetical protein